MILIKNSWIELLSLRLAFRYVPLEDVLVLGSGKIIQRNQVNDIVIGKITGRVLDELVFWFKTLKVDKAEFCCLKTILLFNPGYINCIIFISYSLSWLALLDLDGDSFPMWCPSQ